MKTRAASLVLGAVLAVGALVAVGQPAFALDPYDAPIISCGVSGRGELEIKICGGDVTGAPAGITIQYKKLSDYQVSGWGDQDLCAISLSGQPSLMHPEKSRWELLPGECESVLIGDVNFDETGVSGNDCAMAPLECGTEYVFRAFAHAGRRMGRSDWTVDLICSTLPCENGCTLTQGYWKTHGPGDCNVAAGPNVWPVTNLTLGNVNYTDAQLCAILNTPATGNGLLSLAHQLIAAKFNVLSGAGAACISSAIADADAVIGNLVIPPGGTGFLAPKTTSSLTGTLDQYNNGVICASHCTLQLNGPASQLPSRRETWGEMKTIYR